jgi:broad specificity phosphatase PhoE
MNLATSLPSTAPWLDRRSMVVFLRHGERVSLASDALPGRDAPLTPQGLRDSQALGAMLADRLGVVRSSPVPRCVNTALAIQTGASRQPDVEHDRTLGDPGAFVTDPTRAMESLVAIGLKPTARRLGSGEQLPGFDDPDAAAARLLERVIPLLTDGGSSTHLMITHDLIISVLLARVGGPKFACIDWPEYLHGIVLWNASGACRMQYSGMSGLVSPRLLR